MDVIVFWPSENGEVPVQETQTRVFHEHRCFSDMRISVYSLKPNQAPRESSRADPIAGDRGRISPTQCFARTKTAHLRSVRPRKVAFYVGHRHLTNPDCGTSEYLAMIRNAGIGPMWWSTQNAAEIANAGSLIERMGILPRELLREKGTLSMNWALMTLPRP